MLAAIEVTTLYNYGYLGIIVYMILTGCGLPMPEEVAIVAGAVLAASGKLDWRLTLGALLIGALLGDCVMYLIGRFFGRRLLTKNRFWQRLITPEREAGMEALLAKHGVKVLLGARFLIGVRGPMYITAGILKVPFKRFVLADMFCATLVVTLFFGLAYIYGAQIKNIIHNGEGWLTIVAVTAGIIVGGICLWLYLRRRKKQMVAVAVSTPIAASTAASGLASPIIPTAATTNGQPHDEKKPTPELSPAQTPGKTGE
jgi:membrane protein DedA with SNARE-associated domain